MKPGSFHATHAIRGFWMGARPAKTRSCIARVGPGRLSSYLLCPYTSVLSLRYQPSGRISVSRTPHRSQITGNAAVLHLAWLRRCCSGPRHVHVERGPDGAKTAVYHLTSRRNSDTNPQSGLTARCEYEIQPPFMSSARAGPTRPAIWKWPSRLRRGRSYTR